MKRKWEKETPIYKSVWGRQTHYLFLKVNIVVIITSQRENSFKVILNADLLSLPKTICTYIVLWPSG